tara:strand:- start:1103 stop:2050 length:948 start_codon:yes stop_codon:yes gene_type:complete
MENENRTLDLNKFFEILFQSRNLISSVLALVLSFTLLMTLSMKNVYRAEAILVPTDESSSSSSTNNGVASLASLAGINLGQAGGFADKGTRAIKILESREFVINFLKEYDLVPEIYSEQSWNRSTRKLKLSNDFNEDKRIWIRNKPSDMQTYREFVSNHLKVVTDPDTGFINVTIDHISPDQAHLILVKIIKGLNEHMRQIDLKDSNNAIEYLTGQLQLTNISEVRRVFSNVIESQIQTKMLANISDEYVLKVIDPSRVPDRKFKPRRSAILAITFAITFISLAFVTFILFVQNKRILFKIFPFELSILSLDQEL